MRVQVWLALSVFLASGSIASISETVAKWKSFFLDSVNFYRQYVSLPIHDFLTVQLGFEVTRTISDCLVLLGILVSVNMRVVVSRQATRSSIGTALGGAVGAFLVMIAIIINGSSYSRSEILFITTIMLISSIVVSTGLYMRISRAIFLSWLFYLASPFVIVGIAAAVNVGLSK